MNEGEGETVSINSYSGLAVPSSSQAYLDLSEENNKEDEDEDKDEDEDDEMKGMETESSQSQSQSQSQLSNQTSEEDGEVGNKSDEDEDDKADDDDRGAIARRTTEKDRADDDDDDDDLGAISRRTTEKNVGKRVGDNAGDVKELDGDKAKDVNENADPLIQPDEVSKASGNDGKFGSTLPFIDTSPKVVNVHPIRSAEFEYRGYGDQGKLHAPTRDDSVHALTAFSDRDEL
jgi:hypothetical protein